MDSCATVQPAPDLSGARAVDFLDSDGVNIIRSLNVSDSQLERILKKYGFVDNRMERARGALVAIFAAIGIMAIRKN